ncbi:MAG: hypothetical protein HY056_12455 [Proteobacteria bacterium]|nr:hypothetical protein [Pseudomonadota bacterium]
MIAIVTACLLEVGCASAPSATPSLVAAAPAPSVAPARERERAPPHSEHSNAAAAHPAAAVAPPATQRPKVAALRPAATEGSAATKPRAAPVAAGSVIKDTTAGSYNRDVIEASQRQPVLVYFWQPACAHCIRFTPTLEQRVRASKGRVKLVKLDVAVTSNQSIAEQQGVKGTPAVIAYDKGVPVDRFIGLTTQLDQRVRVFLDGLEKDSASRQ